MEQVFYSSFVFPQLDLFTFSSTNCSFEKARFIVDGWSVFMFVQLFGPSISL